MFWPGIVFVTVTGVAPAPPAVMAADASAGTVYRFTVSEPVYAPSGSILIVYVPAAVRVTGSMNVPFVPTPTGATTVVVPTFTDTLAPATNVPIESFEMLSAMRWFTEPVKVSVPFWPAAAAVKTTPAPPAVMVPVVSPAEVRERPA